MKKSNLQQNKKIKKKKEQMPITRYTKNVRFVEL